jgi:hypothetical protein
VSHIIKLFFVISFLSILLSACSSIPLQTKRMDLAEDLIVEAEQALASKPKNPPVRFAIENIGTANAYLATVNDNKKFLTGYELKRYELLKHRADGIMTRIR